MDFHISKSQYRTFIHFAKIGAVVDDPLTYIIQRILYVSGDDYFRIGYKKKSDKSEKINSYLGSEWEDYYIDITHDLHHSIYTAYELLHKMSSEMDIWLGEMAHAEQILNKTMISYSSFKVKDYYEIGDDQSHLLWKQINREAKRWFVNRDLNYTKVHSLLQYDEILDKKMHEGKHSIRTKKPRNSIFKSDNVKWEQVTFTFPALDESSSYEFYIKWTGERKKYTLSLKEFGFWNIKDNQANKSFLIFKMLSHVGKNEYGDIKESEKARFRKDISNLRKLLKKQIGINDDPFQSFKYMWKPKFNIVFELDSRYVKHDNKTEDFQEWKKYNTQD